MNTASRVDAEYSGAISDSSVVSDPNAVRSRKREGVKIQEAEKRAQKRGKPYNIADTTTFGSNVLLRNDDDDDEVTITSRNLVHTPRCGEHITAILEDALERDATRGNFVESYQSFAHPRAINPSVTDDQYAWTLKGMKTSMWNYQFLAVGKMCRLEDRDSAPLGGLQGDEVGFGSKYTSQYSRSGSDINIRRNCNDAQYHPQ